MRVPGFSAARSSVDAETASVIDMKLPACRCAARSRSTRRRSSSSLPQASRRKAVRDASESSSMTAWKTESTLRLSLIVLHLSPVGCNYQCEFLEAHGSRSPKKFFDENLLILASQFVEEPSPSVSPIPLGSCERDIHHLRSFF